MFCPDGIQILPEGAIEADIAVVMLLMAVVMVVAAAGKQVPVVMIQVYTPATLAEIMEPLEGPTIPGPDQA